MVAERSRSKAQGRKLVYYNSPEWAQDKCYDFISTNYQLPVTNYQLLVSINQLLTKWKQKKLQQLLLMTANRK